MIIRNPLVEGKPALPQIYIITGTDGAGKDTIIKLLIQRNPSLHFAITHTDRAPRAEESNGRDYHFVSTEKFESMIENDEFIEHAIVYDQHKGISRFEIENALNSGKDVLLRINIDGAITVKQQFPSSVAIFIATETKEILLQRLHTRNTDSEEDKQKRISDVERIYSLMNYCDYIVINEHNKLEEAVNNVEKIMSVSKLRMTFTKID